MQRADVYEVSLAVCTSVGYLTLYSNGYQISEVKIDLDPFSLGEEEELEHPYLRGAFQACK